MILYMTFIDFDFPCLCVQIVLLCPSPFCPTIQTYPLKKYTLVTDKANESTTSYLLKK